jgi:hypothetical protein
MVRKRRKSRKNCRKGMCGRKSSNSKLFRRNTRKSSRRRRSKRRFKGGGYRGQPTKFGGTRRKGGNGTLKKIRKRAAKITGAHGYFTPSSKQLKEYASDNQQYAAEKELMRVRDNTRYRNAQDTAYGFQYDSNSIF